MELDDDNVTSSFAVSGDFPLVSAAAIEKMREELLTNKVGQKFQRSSSILRRQMSEIVPKYVQNPSKKRQD